jgi:hypothetical protein
VAALGAVAALASGNSGMSLSPPLLSHAAVAGNVGSMTVTNATGQTMKTSVTVHPWLQATTGLASPNQAASLGGVRLSASSFTLAPGASKVLGLTLTKVPAQGSLYGNVDVVSLPTKRSSGSGVTFGYRLIGSLRLTPVHARLSARVGSVVVNGTHKSGSLSLAITNTGNTLGASGGSLYVRSARAGANASISGINILPGATVDAPFMSVDGVLPAGKYTLTGSVLLAGRRVASVRTSFTLR